jgi:thymidine phosphorylase
MLFTDIIRQKRDGGELDEAQIRFFVDGLADGSIPAEQVSSLAMAIFLNSMSFGEAAKLTMAMAASGVVLDWDKDELDGPVIDKHSTGGVGDKVSFMLAPIAAACGCYVPMISGRGLGHTGGTTDKAESIPGYDTAPDFATFRKVVREVGCAIIGQTADLAPADKRLYAIRDVTGTVESVPLITASILSKKIAAGLGGLVMDVKVGSGAFMESLEKAEQLANSIIATAGRAELPTHAILTDMNEVLGGSAGNALEISESLAYLKNENREPRLDEVVLSLVSEMLLVGGISDDRASARERCEEAISSGRAVEVFARMVSMLGGPSDFVENADTYLPQASVIRPVYAEGFVSGVNGRAVGNAIIELGGGRREVGERLDLSVGFSEVAAVGTELNKDNPLAVIHAASDDDAKRAEKNLRAAFSLSAEAPAQRPVIIRTLTAADICAVS